MKLVKWTLIGLAALIVLSFIGVAVLLLAIDRGEYKQEIIALVAKHTGRELTIGGDLDISLFPWVGISIGELSMANATGFGEAPFVQAHAANIKVEVLPLLRRELRVDTIELVGVALDLQRNAVGANNWDDLTRDSGGSSSTSSGATTAENSPIAALAIGGVKISGARIRWRDAQQGTDAILREFNLRIGAITLHDFFPLQMDFVFKNKVDGIRAQLELSSDVALDIQQQKYQLSGLAFSADVSGPNLPKEGVGVDLTANLGADLIAQRATIRELNGTTASIPFSGEFDIEQLNSAPNIQGEMTVSAFSLRDVMAALDIVSPVTARNDALNAFKLGLAINASSQAASIKIVEGRLDDTNIQGNIEARLGKKIALDVTLALDAINVDHYLPPSAENKASNDAGSNGSGSAADVPIRLPVDTIKQQNLSARLTVGELIVSGLRISNLDLPLAVRNGHINLANASAKLYGGTFDSDAQIDVSAAPSQPPTFITKTHLFGVQIGPLLDDLQGDGLLAGIGDVRLDLHTQGNRITRLKAALNGDVGLNFRDGAIKGVNIAQSLREAKAKIKGNKVEDDGEPKATDFSQLSVNGAITNGVVRSNDLDMRSPLIRVTGKGNVDLNRDYVNYKTRILVTDDSAGQGGKGYGDLSGLKLSVPVRGHFDELNADITGAILAAIREDFDAKLDTQKTETDAKLQAGKDKLKAEQEKLETELTEKKKREKGKAKQKLKDKLKNLLE